jgi:hypothetical protein
MPVVQYKLGTSALDAFDITLDAAPAAHNALILVLTLDAEEAIHATYQSVPLDSATSRSDGRRKLAILFLTDIAAGSSVVHVTRDFAGDSDYTLIEVSRLADVSTPDASNVADGGDNSPGVSLEPTIPAFVIAGFAFSNASTISAFGGSGFKSFSSVGTGTTFEDAAYKDADAAGTYTHSAILSAADNWIACIASFALVPEETLLAEMVEVAESATLPATVNGFTGAELERAFRALDIKFIPRVRAELLDPDLTKLYDLAGMQADGQISYTTDAAIKGAAQLKFLETARDSQHPAPLAAFSALITAQNRLFHLRLGETSGNFADFSGNSRTFTANGTIVYSIGSLTQGDQLNNAIKPNGTTGYLSIADAAWMDVSNIDLELAWSGTGVSQTLIDRDDSGANRFWRFEVDANGLLSLAMNFTTGSRTLYVAAVKVNDGQPHLLSASYDGHYVSLYIDGNRVVHTAETRVMLTGTLGIRIAATNAGTNFSSGIFDETGMLGRVRTPKEILDTYQAWSAQTNELLFDRARAHRVKVYYAIRMPRNGTDGTPWAEYAQGVYLLPTLTRTLESDEGVIDSVSCQDQTSVLNDSKFDTRTLIAFGANWITGTNGVLAIAQSAGFNTSGWAVTVTDKLVTAEAGIDFDINESKLALINYLLKQINYKPIRFNGDGAGVIEPNVIDADAPVAFVLSADDESVILRDGISEETETRKVPTTVLVATANPDGADILGTASLKPGATIIYGQGYVARIIADPPDQATADALARQELNDGLAKFARRFKLTTLPRPIHGDRDKITITVPQMNRDEDFIEEEQTLSLAPTGTMQRSCLSVVDV